jgi:HD-GYP domain-containing protein (c-di-GMP phosphodiesterase class II)
VTLDLRQVTRKAQEVVRRHDRDTGDHLERVGRIARLIAEGLAASHGLDGELIDQLTLAAPLHDIGKIAIPDAILCKQGRLEAGELAVMRTHVEQGLAVLQRLLAADAIPPQPATELMAAVIATHHERLDGSGYPAGLRGEAIPIAGRIVAVADVFDALTGSRPYRRRVAVAEGLALVQQQAADGLLDRACVAALAARQAQLERIVAFSADAAADR